MEKSAMFQCLFHCNSQLPSIHSLLSHMRLIHSFEKNAHLSCCIGKCEKVYTTSDSYRKHVEREHATELKSGRQFNVTAGDPDENFQKFSADMQIEHCVINAANEVDESNISHILQILTKTVTMFALRIREDSVLPKSTSRSIISGMSTLFETFFEHFCKLVVTRLEANGIDVSVDHGLHRLLNDPELMQEVWINVDSDAKLKRFCLQHLSLIEPTKASLGFDKSTGKELFFQYISISKTLKHYIQHENVWFSINQNLIKKKDVLYDYTDGLAFAEHPFFSLHPEALRLSLYVDDLELCNPLGGAKKKHSITAVYFQVGNVEHKYLATVKSIHVVAIANSVLVKKQGGLSSVFGKIASEISLLELEGIEVTVDGKLLNIFASLVAVVADNLASHDMGGFRMCFNSGRICRFCMVCYDEISSFGSESDSNYPKLRTPADHKRHTAAVLADDKLASAYGVNKPAALHSLASFDATTSLPPDCMHDVLEGVVPKILKVCLTGLIAGKFITIGVFNDRLQNFKFGQNDRKNAPNPLSLSFPKIAVSGSASQKWCLFRHLAFIIGELVPADSKYWELYVLCRKMCEIIFAPAVTVSQVVYLDMLIKDHHSLLLELAPSEFTPKFHFLTHYPRLMAFYGPLRHLWCMRFESYHQYLKSVAQHTGNFKNICHTLAERNQLRKCVEQSSDYCLGSDEMVSRVQSKSCISSFPLLLQRPIVAYFGCSARCQVISVKSVVVNAVHYAVDNCFIIDVVHGDVPVFFVVSYILSYDGIWALAGNLAFCSKFLSHYHAYVITCDPDWVILKPGRELSYVALDIYKIRTSACEEQLVSLRTSIPF